jgi:hypothetical protein
MQYLMLVMVESEPAPDAAGASQRPEPVEPWVEEMDGRGVRLMGNVLRPVAEAASVRVRGGEVLLTDGPFTETKELIAGFDVLECKDLAAAIEVAAKHPMAKVGRLELRQMIPD